MTTKTVMVNLTPKTKMKEEDENQMDTKVVLPKQPKKRSITFNSSWAFSPDELSQPQQVLYVEQLHINNVTDTNACMLITKHINQKINGYKTQDKKKGLYDLQNIVDEEYVFNEIYKSKHICFYCNEGVHVLYENAREPKQWTLDRINNDIGHNKNNVVIACLQCNVSRKTMYHERYAFTKQLVLIKRN
mgnify:CR=1 FL=1|jgi:hypothetical protein|tara:strand:+ start:264 stop:830 length:567 start_codon:yes stop_codon:yes gene_type:complete